MPRRESTGSRNSEVGGRNDEELGEKSAGGTQDAERKSNVPRSDLRAVVIGGSAGAMDVLLTLLSDLPPDFALPVLVVQHLHATDRGRFAHYVNEMVALRVLEPCDKDAIRSGCVYVAPADYHMLVERDGTIALSVDERVNWSRPSIDVLFESASRTWGEGLVALILSGASHDGMRGMGAVKSFGGLTIAQDPSTAEHPVMPQAAIDTGAVDEVLRPEEIGGRLLEVQNTPSSERGARNAGIGRNQ